MITVCPSNNYGPSCAKCPKKCRSCDSITGVCIQCQESYYGEFCHLNCPVNCLNLTCDQQTWSCNGCKERFEVKSCELEMASLSISTGFSIFFIYIINFHCLCRWSFFDVYIFNCCYRKYSSFIWWNLWQINLNSQRRQFRSQNINDNIYVMIKYI